MKEQFELLQQYLHGIWFKRKWVFVTMWLLSIIGWSVVTILPNKYTAEARVYADTRTILQPLLKGIAINNDPSKELMLMVKTLLSRRNLETIASYTQADISASSKEEYNKILEDLKENLVIKSAGKENLFTISYSGRDKEYVKEVVQAALDVFVENAVGHKKQDSLNANEFLASQLSLYEKRLLDSEKVLADFKRNNSGYLPGSEQSYILRVEVIKSELEDTKLEREEALSELQSAERQLNYEKRLNLKNKSSIKTEYDVRLEVLQTRLDELLFRYTDVHPDVKETKRQINDLVKMKSSIITGGLASNIATPMIQEIKLSIGTIKNKVASLTVRKKALEEKLSELEDKLKNVPKIEAELTSLMRNYEVTKKQYHQLLTRRESALISQDVDANSDQISFQIVDPPMIPREASGPNRPLLLAGVFVVSLGSGVMLAFLASQLFPRVYSSRQLFVAFDFPIYGEVSEHSRNGVKSQNNSHVLNMILNMLLVIFVFIVFNVINSTYFETLLVNRIIL